MIFQYATVTSEPHQIPVKRINSYLINAENILINSRSKPISNIPEMTYGNKPVDGGHLILSDDEKKDFVNKEPNAEKYIKPLISAREFINGMQRWCIWLVDADPSELRKMPEVLKRIGAVKQTRLASIDPQANILASTPSLFRDKNNPDSFIVIPRHSSENRKYIL